MATFLFGDQPQSEAERNKGGVDIMVKAVEDVLSGNRPTGRLPDRTISRIFGGFVGVEGLVAAAQQQLTIEERTRAAQEQLRQNRPDVGRTDP